MDDSLVTTMDQDQKRGRGRPRKIVVDIKIEDPNIIKRGRGRPKKVLSENNAPKPKIKDISPSRFYKSEKNISVGEIRTEKKDHLTQLVLDYRELCLKATKETDKNEILKLEHKANCMMPEILRLTRASVFEIMGYYGVNNYDQSIQDEIASDCISSILLKTIEAFDEGRNTKFNTFYMWRLKSHVRSRKEFFVRRMEVLNIPSIETVLFNDGGKSVTLEDIYNSSCNVSSVPRAKKARQILYLADEKLNKLMSKIK